MKTSDVQNMHILLNIVIKFDFIYTVYCNFVTREIVSIVIGLQIQLKTNNPSLWLYIMLTSTFCNCIRGNFSHGHINNCCNSSSKTVIGVTINNCYLKCTINICYLLAGEGNKRWFMPWLPLIGSPTYQQILNVSYAFKWT